MARPKCHPSENIVRAITTADWDEVEQRAQSSLFRGSHTSVSRLAVLGLRELFAIFRRDLEKYPRLVLKAGEINVGVLQEIGRQHVHPTELTVEQDPLEDNPAHAEIPQQISKGLATRINKSLQLRDPPPPE